MKKRLIALVLSIVLAVGNVGAVPVFAAETTAEEAVPVEELEEVSEEIEDADPNIVTEEISVDDPAEPVEEKIGPESGESIEESESIYEQDAVEEGKPAEEAISSDEEGEGYPIEAEEIALEEDIVTNEDNKDVGDVVASGTCGESLTWELEDGTLTISGTGEMYEMYQFNNSGKYYAPWYSCQEQITTIVINSGVTNISSNAFTKCSNLTSVTIPDSVTSIGGYAFCNCSNLTSVTIPDSVTVIGGYAFSNCSSLTSVSIGRGVTSIWSEAFSNCSSLTSVTIPDSVTSIGIGAFSGCSSLTSVTIPDSVTSIGDGAFYGCSSLTSVTIPSGVTSIGGGAFSGCSRLTGSITIPEGVTTIENTTFRDCSNLTSVTIPDSVTSIGDGAFYGCSSLTSVTIPNSVTSIGDNAFSGCSSLTSVTIPNSVTIIESYTFYGCSSLTSVTIPDSVTIIESYAFYGCRSLMSVTIPDGVTIIKSYTFYGCSSLTSVTIPDGVKYIGDYEFFGCSNLTSVTIPDSVTNIGGHAFSGCSSLTSVAIPDSVIYIFDHAFFGCRNLTSVTIPDSVTVIEGSAFYNCSSLTSVTIGSGVKTIRNYAFQNCSSLTSVSIGSGVTSIQSSAFRDCSNLTSVTIPDSVTSIGDNAFRGCSSLTSVTIGSGVISIESYAFCNCSSLTSVTIPDGVTYISDYAFSGCSSLTSVTIPNSVTSIGDNAFSGCSSLTSVTIPNSVTSIRSYAFSNCSSLTSVTIPDSVTSIQSSAFRGCSNLKSVYFTGDAPSFGSDVFKNATLTAYYPKNNATWTDSVKQNYGGTITWVTWSPGYNHFFILGEDSNQFAHYGLPYKFDDNSIKNKLYTSTLLTWDNTFELYKYLDGKTKGVCHGIALSMCYGNQGFIDFKSISPTASNYWQLGNPLNNPAFKDVILYYHLLQLSKGGGATKRVDKGGWHLKSLESRLNEFLSALVDEAKKSSSKKKPFVFGFRHDDDGHSVVVCGYIWNERTRNHEIIIYDENSFNGQNGDYCIMSVPEDCQSFEFADANAVYGGYTIQDTWSSLEIYGIDSIYGSSNILKRTVALDSNETTTFKIPAGIVFRIEDDNGKWISFDGSNYLGNMTIYDCYISGLDNDPYWNITIDSTSKLTLTDFDQECELITQIEGRGYAVSTSGAESIVLQPGGVTAEGSSYSLDVSVQSEKYDILQVQTNAKGTTTVNVDNEVLTVSSTEKCDDVKAWVHDQTITTQYVTEIDENGDVIIDFENNNTLNEITPTITLSPVSFVYNGKIQKPTVIVKDGNTVLSPSDYTVNWPSGCTNAGTYQVSIILKGKYSGMATESFMILPGKITRGDMFNLANNVKVTWKEVPGAKYYKVYREGITDKKETQKEPVIVTERLIGWDSQPGLTNGHAYRYKIVASLTGKGDSSGDSTLSYSKVMYRLKTVVIRSVKNTAPGKVTVKYDKTTSGDSYVLQYCERQDMVGAKTKVVLGANNTFYTIGGLKKGKTYYISIRVRKKVNGIDYYTTFGVPKKITITK